MLVDMLLPPLCVDADHHKGKRYVHFVVLKVRLSRMNRKKVCPLCCFQSTLQPDEPDFYYEGRTAYFLELFENGVTANRRLPKNIFS